MTDEEFDNFDVRINHKKYPKGDLRRLTDIADALTKAGERHVKEGTSTGIAIQCQKLPALEAKKLIEQYALQVAEKAVEEEKSSHSTGSPRGPVTMANMILTRIRTLTETGGRS